jgi:hypothetical protein
MVRILGYKEPDTDEQRALIEAAPIENLVEIHFFLEYSFPLTNALAPSRAAHQTAFTLSTGFFHTSRDTNDIYFAHAVTYLIALAEKQPTVGWLPAWLSPGQAERGKRRAGNAEIVEALA